jgi:hypothetical protein
VPVSYKKEIQYDVIVIDIDKSMSLAVGIKEKIQQTSYFN